MQLLQPAVGAAGRMLVLLAVAAALLTGVAAQHCEALRNGSACDGVLEYAGSVYIADGKCQDGLETAGATPLQGSLPVLNPTCREAAALYGCAKNYPRCSTEPDGSGGTITTALRPCQSLCQAAYAACPTESGSVLPNVGISLPAECAGLPTTNCYAGPSTANPSGWVQHTAYARCEALAAGSLCDGVVDYPVYVPAHYTQSYFETNLQQSLPVVYIAPRGSCVTSLLKYLCARAYLPCDTDVIKRALGVPLLTPFPRLPCNRVCTNFARDCSGLLASNPRLSALVPNCSTTGQYQPPKTNCGNLTAAGGADFPRVSSTWATTPPPNSATLKTYCNAWALNDSQTDAVQAANADPSSAQYNVDRTVSPTIRCPYPLVVPDDPNSVNPIGGSCALPCPLPLLTRSEYYGFDRFFLVCAWTAIVLSGFLVVTWLVMPERRRQTLVLCFLVCVWFSTLPFVADLIPTANAGPHAPPENTLIFDRNTCKSNSEKLDHTHPRFAYCVATAGIRHFFLTGIYGWWTVQAFDLFMRVGFPFYKMPAWTHLVYHACVWGVSALVVAIAAATKSYGPTQLMPICYVSDQDIDWWLTYLPLGTALVVGTALVIGILVFLFRSNARVAGSTHGRTKRDLSAQKALLQVLLVFDLVLLFPLIYRLQVYGEQSAITQSTQDWVQCLLQNPGGVDACGEHPAVRPNFGMLCIVMFLSGGSGILAFAVYGSRGDLYRDWAVTCKCRKPGGSSDASLVASGDKPHGGVQMLHGNKHNNPGSPHSPHSPNHTKLLSANGQPVPAPLMRDFTARRYEVGPASNHTPAPPGVYATNPSSPQHSRVGLGGRPLSPDADNSLLVAPPPRLVASGTNTPALGFSVAPPPREPAPVRVGTFVSPAPPASPGLPPLTASSASSPPMPTRGGPGGPHAPQASPPAGPGATLSSIGSAAVSASGSGAMATGSASPRRLIGNAFSPFAPPAANAGGAAGMGPPPTIAMVRQASAAAIASVRAERSRSSNPTSPTSQHGRPR